MTPEGILQTKSLTIPKEMFLGPRDRSKTQRSKLSTRKSILLDATGTSSAKRIPEETIGKGVHLTVQKPICCSFLLYQKEKWRTTTCPRLLKGE